MKSNPIDFCRDRLTEHQQAVADEYFASGARAISVTAGRLGTTLKIVADQGGEIAYWEIDPEGSLDLITRSGDLPATEDPKLGHLIARVFTPGQEVADIKQALLELALAVAEDSAPEPKSDEADDQLVFESRLYDIALRSLHNIADAAMQAEQALVRQIQEKGLSFLNENEAWIPLADRLIDLTPSEQQQAKAGSARQLADWTQIANRVLLEQGAVEPDELDEINRNTGVSILRRAASAVNSVMEETPGEDDDPEEFKALRVEKLRRVVQDAKTLTVREFEEQWVEKRVPPVPISITRWPGQDKRTITCEVAIDRQMETFLGRLRGWYTLADYPPPLSPRMVLDESRSRQELVRLLELRNPLKFAIASLLERGALAFDEIYQSVDADPDVVRAALSDLTIYEILERITSYGDGDSPVTVWSLKEEGDEEATPSHPDSTATDEVAADDEFIPF